LVQQIKKRELQNRKEKRRKKLQKMKEKRTQLTSSKSIQSAGSTAPRHAHSSTAPRAQPLMLSPLSPCLADPAPTLAAASQNRFAQEEEK
jgi:hypothetical protein